MRDASFANVTALYRCSRSVLTNAGAFTLGQGAIRGPPNLSFAPNDLWSQQQYTVVPRGVFGGWSG